MKNVLSLVVVLLTSTFAQAIVHPPGTILNVACGQNILEAGSPELVTEVCIAESRDAEFVLTRYVRVSTQDQELLFRVEEVNSDSSFLDVIESLETWQLTDAQGNQLSFSVTLGENGLPSSIRGQLINGLSFDAQNFALLYHIQLVQ